MKRCSTGLGDEEVALVAEYARPGSEANRLLQALVPEVTVRSESSAIRALLRAGHRAADEERLQQAYERAVRAGEIDAETLAWHAAASREAAALWGQE
jgi:hypothetical protein